jgi:glycosyltransferase involved in cell wall biosynthesis
MEDAEAQARPRVIYVSYDGAGEPLGRSQVVAYLVRLARACDVTLISFEKGHASRSQTARLLAEAGIAWLPRTYHRRPPVASTLFDVLTGARAVRRAAHASGVDIVHVRSYVPALMALVSTMLRRRRWRMLFDIRGFWADERVAGGLWRQQGAIYRVAKRCERRFFAEADAVVTLTQASVPQIRRWLRGRPVPVTVIPTCAEVEQFSETKPSPDGPRVVWCGSLGTFYRFDLAVRFATAVGLPMMVLTRQTDLARAQLNGREADVREVAPEDVPSQLRAGDIGMCFIADGFANVARAPTRFAEYLAAGLAVAVTDGVGDFDAIVLDHSLGVIVDDESDAGLERAATQILQLIRHGAVTDRGRRIARERYSVDAGARTYLALYRRLQQPHV